MSFEYNPKKSEGNKTKHGIDFEEATALWNDPRLLEIEAQTADELRYLVIGTIDARHWTGVITYRNDTIRIISVRRSREKEIELYEEN